MSAMGSRSATLSAGRVSDKLVRQQLSRILSSKTFAQVERLKRFVSFIVGETMGGRGGCARDSPATTAMRATTTS